MLGLSNKYTADAQDSTFCCHKKTKKVKYYKKISKQQVTK